MIGEPRRVGLRDRAASASIVGVERDQGVGIADVATGVAAMQRLLVGVPEVEVRRDGDEAVARETLRQVAGVADEPVALVHDDHGRGLRGAVRHGDEGRHVAGAGDRRAADAAHGFDVLA